MSELESLWQQRCSIKHMPSILPPAERIIVIGDIHGDMAKLIECLTIAGVIKMINSQPKWIGENTIVVQVGDQIDSCRYDGMNMCNDPNNYTVDRPDDINILYLMTELHNQSIKYGGAVYSLMGNHELMNAMGDMSYVSHSNIKHMSNYRTKHSIIYNGMDARKHIFAPGNELANFLACTRKMALVIGTNLFAHAGIVPYIAQKYSIEDMNTILSKYLFNEYVEPSAIYDLFGSSAKSPMWTRVFGSNSLQSDYSKGCNELIENLKVYKVGSIYVGHTPQLQNGITGKCNNKIVLTDVGMSHAFDAFDIVNENL